jgi:hypothetical protein
MRYETMRGRRLLAVLVAVGSAATISAGGLMIAHAAHGALTPVPVTGAPGRLVLDADPYPAEFLDLSPGDPAYWTVRASLQHAIRATLSLELRKDGAIVTHPSGLRMGIAECAEPWTALDAVPQCGSGSRPITVATPADDYAASSPSFVLTSLEPQSPNYLLVTLEVEDSAAARADETLMGLTGTMGVGLTAVSIDDVPVPPDRGRDPLAATGIDGAWLIGTATVAAGLVGLGAALRMGRRGVRR